MAKSLSDSSSDPKREMEAGLRAMRSGFERKLREEFGPQIIDEFIHRIEASIASCQKLPSVFEMRSDIMGIVKNSIDDLKREVDERIKSILKNELEAAVRNIWANYVKGELDKRFASAQTVLDIAKKVKELM